MAILNAPVRAMQEQDLRDATAAAILGTRARVSVFANAPVSAPTYQSFAASPMATSPVSLLAAPVSVPLVGEVPAWGLFAGGLLVWILLRR